ncbi:hypothetical protein CO662_36650 [Rhizobium anhuiense]|uniref:Uncharacterized protein n=1 Tax=Rhizobium anhuiense TaxID=1184720 RepID=A0ABX4IW53_9HYPH|nr:hypothetical protein [Rhizobium anhuiense]PDS43166.1 hypothetical protein CO668_18830 [Rhizobium anhuiense]PDS45770.1 hypothetical protein CO662_36650 [Rhizobium anhuiense]
MKGVAKRGQDFSPDGFRERGQPFIVVQGLAERAEVIPKRRPGTNGQDGVVAGALAPLKNLNVPHEPIELSPEIEKMILCFEAEIVPAVLFQDKQRRWLWIALLVFGSYVEVHFPPKNRGLVELKLLPQRARFSSGA